MKLIRRILALVFLLGLTWLFLDFTGTAQHCTGWMAMLQLLPAALAFHWVILLFLLVLTLLFGRVYCSIICPLGVMQDIISWIAGKLQIDKNKRRFGRFHYQDGPGLHILRGTLFAVFVVCIFAGFGTFVQLLAPYSSFGRMVTMMLQPLYELANNKLADHAEAAGTFDYYQVDVWMRSMPVFIVAAVSFVVIFLMAWIDGRFYCNNICPVGAFLGILSRHSLFGIRIDADRCKSCRLCERSCKGSAIFIPTKAERDRGLKPSVNRSRCVTCFDCLDKCAHGALKFRTAPAPAPAPAVSNAAASESSQPSAAAGPTRRAFLTATATVLATTVIKAEEKTTDGGMAILIDKKRPVRKTPIVPPGAISLRHIQSKCTGCQLCVSECPNGVLRPSNDLMHMMVPESSYERGFCRPECTRCSDVCPAGAIVKFKGDAEQRKATKASTKIGTAVWVRANCVPLTDGVSCGLCSRRCPSGAITMVPSDPNDEKSLKIPTIDAEICIGCGACENLCPARPFSAIYVEGIDQQREI